MDKKDPKGKGGLMLAIGLDDKNAPDSKRGKADEEDEGKGDAFEEAAGEMFDALKADDREAFAEALQAAIYACQE